MTVTNQRLIMWYNSVNDWQMQYFCHHICGHIKNDPNVAELGQRQLEQMINCYMTHATEACSICNFAVKSRKSTISHGHASFNGWMTVTSDPAPLKKGPQSQVNG